jgi:hypothetical protein
MEAYFSPDQKEQAKKKREEESEGVKIVKK